MTTSLEYASPAGRPRRRFGCGSLAWGILIGCVAGVGMLVLLSVLLTQRTEPAHTRVALNEFELYLKTGEVSSVVIEGDDLRGSFVQPRPTVGSAVSATRFRVALPPGMTSDWAFVQWLLANRHGATVEVGRVPNDFVANILLPLVPWLVIFGLLWVLVVRPLRQTAIANAAIQGQAAAGPARGMSGPRNLPPP